MNINYGNSGKRSQMMCAKMLWQCDTGQCYTLITTTSIAFRRKLSEICWMSAVFGVNFPVNAHRFISTHFPFIRLIY